jgi:hypothetical protein
MLRRHEHVLAYPQYAAGNKPLSRNTINTVIDFYREDGISRISPNSKDIIQINKNPISLRFMEMTVIEAFHIFQERLPNAVSQSSFYSLKPREVKITSPHDTCICLYHENMNLALKVSVLFPEHILSCYFLTETFN